MMNKKFAKNEQNRKEHTEMERNKPGLLRLDELDPKKEQFENLEVGIRAWSWKGYQREDKGCKSVHPTTICKN